MKKQEAPFHLGTLIDRQAEKYGHHAELYFKNEQKDKWQSLSWFRMAKHVNALAGALVEKGLQDGDRVGFFAQNCPEIILGDLAAIKAHAVTIPLYATSTIDQAEYIVNNAKISFLFTGEQVHYNIALGLLQRCPSLKWVIAIDSDIEIVDNKQTIRYQDFLALGEATPHIEEIAARQERLSQDDLTSILYTSGTTGTPKGVMLHQWNYTECMRIHNDRLAVTNDHDRSLCFLPLTHILERAWCYFCLQRGITIYINKRPAEIQKTILEVRPNLMCAVPRFWEKVYAAINKKIEAFPPLTRNFARHCLKTGSRYHELRRSNQHIPTGLRLRYKFIASPIFHVVKKAAGIEHGKFFPCAGAKLSDEINEFLHAMGLNICIGYGLTESTATVCCYPTNNRGYHINSIGRIMPDLQVRISEEGEIQLKGKTIISGYYERPDANAEAFTEDGWFKTGDAGYIDMENNLYLTDRIKDLFKTAGGKYIAPQHLEGLVCDNRFVDQAVAIGNERKFVTMLIVPDFVELSEFAQSKNLSFTNNSELVQLPEVKELYDRVIAECNTKLARYEQIKYYTLLPKPFTMEQGHLTNTLKIKRKVIAQLFEKEIDAMYPKD